MTIPPSSTARPQGSTVALVPLWINGRASASVSSRAGDVTNPATGEVVRTVPFANAADADAAARAAAAAFPAWRSTPSLRRARVLARFRELMERHQREIAAVATTNSI